MNALLLRSNDEKKNPSSRDWMSLITAFFQPKLFQVREVTFMYLISKTVSAKEANKLITPRQHFI